MSLLSAIRVALAALRVNKGRSALTSLGIVIGISTVIAMVSAGAAVREKLDQLLDGVGKNLILVRARPRSQQDFVKSYLPLTAEDANAIRKEAGHLLIGVAESQALQRPASTRTRQRSTLITGTVPDLQRVRSWSVPQGRFLSEEDLKQEACVCLLGQTVARDLFPGKSAPLGEIVRIDGVEFRVIGLLGPKGRLPIGFDQDDQIFVPLTTLQSKLAGEKKILIITAAARSSDLVDEAKETIGRVMQNRHRSRAVSEDQVDITTVKEMSELAVVAALAMQALIAVIASVSLVVGGIGVMNILLASVAERTREIGLRMAVGATPGSVMLQFIMEGVVLSLIGGLLGVILGIIGAIALTSIAGWQPTVSPAVVAIAVLVSAAVGVIFSYYPAWKASRLDPMVALRCE